MANFELDVSDMDDLVAATDFGAAHTEDFFSPASMILRLLEY